ncbi:DMT family transporter [Acuticoccus sp. I52.16.1]|uniref:DMT family transporter n=1 Tax=Acuticoccus sp. I52.16.1 TaxID=2928472 RepID=UPI001FCFD2BE|nr:DMT family transporter [Acuticoccus sp. I52.16.1]UOM34969.1 DMT family transporter [Acuticoccus sp. I52.16.1]
MAVSYENGDDRSGQGLALYAGAMLFIPVLDAMGKVLVQTISPFEIHFVRNLVQTVILLVALPLMGRVIFTPQVRAHWLKIAGVGFFLANTGCFLFWSLQSLPLANAIAIFFVEPLILTMFCVVFLGERVGIHRTSAVLVGLLGAIVVIRPNFAAFGIAAIMPLVAATAFAAGMTVLRRVSGRVDAVRIQAVAGIFGSTYLGLVLLVGGVLGVEIMEFTMPSPDLWHLLLALGLGATAAQLAITVALRFTEASAVAPFQYLEIVAATAIGYLWFGDFPDALTWVGTGLILASGLYVAHRERRLAADRRRAGRDARSVALSAPQEPLP